MNLVVFNSPCGRVVDHTIMLATVPVLGDRIDFGHGIYTAAKRKLDLVSLTWQVEVSR